MKIEKIKDSVWSTISKFLAIPIIWQDQKFDRTKLLADNNAYCTLKLFSGVQNIGTDIEEVLGNNSMRSSGNREIIFSINIYGRNAVELMSNLNDLMFTSVFRHSLHFEAIQYGLDIAMVDAPDLKNLSELMQDTFEDRSQIDFRIRVVSETVFDVELIEHVSTDPNSGFDRYENDPNRINDTITL